MIKVILFDLGGTYAKGSAKQFVAKAYRVLNILSDFSTSNAIFDLAFNKGQISIQEFFTRYFRLPISEKQMQELVDLWKNTWKPEPRMLELVNRLKKKYRLGMISNSDAVNSPNYAKKGWYEPFEAVVLSHELGILKPDPAIYKIALKKMKVPANECLFIDDQKTCLETAKKLGMKTIRFQSVGQLKKDLKRIGIQY